MSYLNTKTKKLLGLGVVLSLFVLFLSPVTNAFSDLAEEALDPNAKLAVTPQGFDDMGDILTRLGFKYNTISLEDLGDYSKLKQYDAIFVNCSTGIYVSDEQGETIRKYVENGGFVYASDWADVLVEKAYPDKVNFHGEKDGSGSHLGTAGKITAEITDTGLASVLSKEKIEVNYDLGGWAVIESANKGVRVHMTGPYNYYDYSSIDYSNPDSYNNNTGQKTKTVPYVVSFSEGDGEVLYTSFHNESQNTEDMEKALNWFAVKAKAGKLAQTTRDLASGDDEILQEVIDTLKEGESKEYEFEATGDAKFDVNINFGGSEIKLSVEDPDGKQVDTKSVSTPPYTMSVSDAKKGTYKITVEGVDIPEDNYPFVASVTGEEKAAVNPLGKLATGDKSETNNVVTTEKATAQSFMDQLAAGLLKGLVIALIVVVIIVVLVIVILKGRKSKIVPNQPIQGQATPPVQTQTPPAAPQPQSTEAAPAPTVTPEVKAPKKQKTEKKK